MPKRKRDHEDANNNHVKASKDVPQPKRLQKKPAEKSSDQQKEKKEEPLEDPQLEGMRMAEGNINKSTKELTGMCSEAKDEFVGFRAQYGVDMDDFRSKIDRLLADFQSKIDRLLAKIVDPPTSKEDVPAPDILKKKMPKRKQDHEDANNSHVKASKDVPQPKKLQKKPAEKSSDQQKEKKEEPLDPIAETRLCQQRFVSAKQTENLSKLTYDLLVEIAKRLQKLEDFTCFRSVSKSLHLCVKKEYFEGVRFRQSIPYLMLPPAMSRDGNDDIRQFYSLVEGESIVASLDVPMLKGSKMCFESLGWLLSVEVDGSMSLFDPFSDTEIPVPHQNTFPNLEWLKWDKRFLIKKMVLSSRPNETSDFILMVIIGDLSNLAFWRLGDEAWNKIKIDDRKVPFRDVVYDGGEQFYAISCQGIIWVINLAGNDNGRHFECRIIIDCEPVLGILICCQNQYILKTIDGSLLGITRTKEGRTKERRYSLTVNFTCMKLIQRRAHGRRFTAWEAWPSSSDAIPQSLWMPPQTE